MDIIRGGLQNLAEPLVWRHVRLSPKTNHARTLQVVIKRWLSSPLRIPRMSADPHASNIPHAPSRPLFPRIRSRRSGTRQMSQRLYSCSTLTDRKPSHLGIFPRTNLASSYQYAGLRDHAATSSLLFMIYTAFSLFTDSNPV
jgi:hypothetical protein